MTTALPIIAVFGVALFVLFPFSAFAWQHVNTRGLAYFGRPLASRRRMRARIAALGAPVSLALRPFIGALRKPNKFAIERDGVHYPGNNCNRATLSAALGYAPTADDVFVVTQMKCGTTWMLQVVYEVLSRGRGDLSDDGHGHLSALSPWLESFNGVSIDDAPRVDGRRIIKTHLRPTTGDAPSCPYAAEARYIYVARHPVSCFRSCVDFFTSVAGPLSPTRASLLDWFCSDQMWWGDWPSHVAAGWRWRERPNVLFVRFEDMKRDLAGVVRDVAEHLSVALDASEVAEVVRKSSFDHMRANEELFEVVPPNFFATGESFFRRGSLPATEPVTDAERARIAAFAADHLRGSDYPLGEHYPDLTEA